MADFKKQLWDSADKLRNQIDAAEYKHIVLGLIFLKYISDSFSSHRKYLIKTLTDPKSDFFINEDEGEIQKELEDRDYYKKDNIFWVPRGARWEDLRSKAKQPDIASLIDSAMTLIENENDNLRGKLDKRFGRTQFQQGTLGELIDLISTIGFEKQDNEKDILGEVYEYFLGQFASAEGKKGGQFYTPSHIVKTLVAVLSPTNGRVYDPCCGSGGMFVQSERFIQAHGGRVDDISIYGQESNPTTWRLAAMNMAIRGYYADLGKEPNDTFANDQFSDLKFDYIMANPPFNISDWGGEKYDNDPRWKYGRPPAGNANYAWLQHIIWKLRPGGSAGVVLANIAMSSDTGGEEDIRRAMVRGDVVEIMVALPGQLFLNTQIPACLWFLTNDKTRNGRDRKGETLFIDARKLGTMVTRALKTFTDSDITKIQDTVQSWKTGEGYEDISGFCKSASMLEIEKNDFALTPGRYVGALDTEDDGIPFVEKISSLNDQLSALNRKSDLLDSSIRLTLDGILSE